jgi:hypothetical protein
MQGSNNELTALDEGVVLDRRREERKGELGGLMNFQTVVIQPFRCFRLVCEEAAWDGRTRLRFRYVASSAF